MGDFLLISLKNPFTRLVLRKDISKGNGKIGKSYYF